MSDTSRSCSPPVHATDLEIEIAVDLDDSRQTLVFLRAAGDPPGTEDKADKADKAPVSDVRVDRLIWDAALSADEAARNEHRRRVVAPLLMLLALGLLFAAGWSW